METLPLAAGITFCVLTAAIVQRVSGVGFGMILAPFVVVMLGAHEGVMLANFLSVIAPVFMMVRVWQDIDWRIFWWLALPAIASMPAAAWVSVRSDPGLIYMAVGCIVIFGLMTSLWLGRVNIHYDGTLLRLGVGVGAGAGTVLAAVGAPATSIYAVISRWDVRAMVATLQPMWMLISAVSFGLKWSMDTGQLPQLPWWAWAASAPAILLGIVLGERIQRRVNDATVRGGVVVLAFIGALMALGMGIYEVLGTS